MKVCILMGSPRLQGNTAELLKPFITELEESGSDIVYITLADKHISPCQACYTCQNITGEYGCRLQDEMQEIVSQIVQSDCVVLATPIFTWYCPPEMKAMLDRFYGMNKYYGSGNGSLWLNKKIAIIATHGYNRKYATLPFETGVKHLCEHSKLKYLGMYSIRDEDDLASFRTDEAINGAKLFAKKIMKRVKQNEV